MAKTATLDHPTDLGPVAEDPVVRAARAAIDAAVAARDRTAAEARALRTTLAQPVGAGDGLAVPRARVGLPAAERAEAEAALVYEEATAASVRIEREALAARWPASRARVRELVAQLYQIPDAGVMPVMVALRDQLAAENAALGRAAFPPGELLRPEFLGPTPGDSLLEHRRRLLTQQSWLGLSRVPPLDAPLSATHAGRDVRGYGLRPRASGTGCHAAARPGHARAR